MKRFSILLALTLGVGGLAYGFGEPRHSAVVVKTEAKDAALEFTFKVEPKSGMAINLEGPWKLDVKKADGLTFAKSTLSRNELDEGLTGFVIKTSAKPAKTSGEIEYALTSFICTADKTQCYREVHKGKHTWQTAAK